MNSQTTNKSISAKAKDYLDFDHVPDLLAELRSKEYPVSDIFCKDPKTGRTLYFVDLVQQGGGVLGIALVGYTMALEAAGIRFLSLAGTSAGAINTVLMAGCGKPVEERSGVILEEICKKEFYEFVDPGRRVLLPVKGLLSKNPVVKLISGIGLVLLNLPGLLKRGLCTGNAFEQWVEKVLKNQKIESVDQLIKQMNDLPKGLKIRPHKKRARNAHKGEVYAHLAIVAADVTTQTKVEFPRMAELYVPTKPDVPVVEGMYGHLELSPKDMVRASMAIPMFFRPKVFTPSQNGEATKEKWRKMAEFHGEIPTMVRMVDGGIMSNFPIDLFHVIDSTPKRPTFGIRLGLNRNKASGTGRLLSHAAAIFNGARNLRDFEFLFKNEDYKHLVQYIDTADYNWLNFSISKEEKQQLFQLGVKAAYEFLEGSKKGEKTVAGITERNAFNWKEYQSIRRRIIFSSSSDRLESLWSKEDAIRKLGLDEEMVLKPGDATTYEIEELKARVPEPAKNWFPDNFISFNKNLKIIHAYTKKFGTVKILWVDDDPANDFFELSVLRALEIKYATAMSNNEAIAKLQGNPDILLIVTDSHRQNDPNEGLKLCKKLMEKGCPLPILLHSVSKSTKYVYKKQENAEKKALFVKQIQDKYSTLIRGNFIDARELIIAVVEELAKAISNKHKK
ncbi:MAG: patatin-like phospholipase family protein [Phycisphaerae bacterium]|nr:patatin-like phospholipase family protein [Saprospiraceae bacterium]